ncbi:MAG: GxxExxY protein [Patescibacteria group bacterium]
MQQSQNNKIIEKELSYELNGIFFGIQSKQGRFCREKQYSDALEIELKKKDIPYQREHPIPVSGVKSNFVDFAVGDKILVDFKAKPFIEKDDYYQMKRYLEASNFELGLIVNFRQKHLQPKRVLNSKFSEHSDVFVVSDRVHGQALIEALVAASVLVVGFLGMFALLTRSLFLNRIVSDSYIGNYLAAEGIEVIKNIIDTNALNNRSFDAGINNCFSSACSYEVQYFTCASAAQCSPSSFVPGHQLSFDPSTGYYSYSGTVQTGFVREVRLQLINLSGDPSFEAVRVNSIVTWTTGAAQQQANLEDIFYDWRP